MAYLVSRALDQLVDTGHCLSVPIDSDLSIVDDVIKKFSQLMAGSHDERASSMSEWSCTH